MFYGSRTVLIGYSRVSGKLYRLSCCGKRNIYKVKVVSFVKAKRKSPVLYTVYFINRGLNLTRKTKFAYKKGSGPDGLVLDLFNFK